MNSLSNILDNIRIKAQEMKERSNEKLFSIEDSDMLISKFLYRLSNSDFFANEKRSLMEIKKDWVDLNEAYTIENKESYVRMQNTYSNLQNKDPRYSDSLNILRYRMAKIFDKFCHEESIDKGSIANMLFDTQQKIYKNDSKSKIMTTEQLTETLKFNAAVEKAYSETLTYFKVHPLEDKDNSLSV